MLVTNFLLLDFGPYYAYYILTQLSGSILLTSDNWHPMTNSKMKKTSKSGSPLTPLFLVP